MAFDATYSILDYSFVHLQYVMHLMQVMIYTVVLNQCSMQFNSVAILSNVRLAESEKISFLNKQKSSAFY